MYHPTRGGARGGAAEFSWDKVKQSKDREFYLGNSVAAPTGRWQDGRDINWYNKDKNDASSSSSAADERREELRKIKEAETAALYARLGRPPPAPMGEGAAVVGERLAGGSSGMGGREGTGANRAPLKAGEKKWGNEAEEEVSEADKRLARKFAREEVKRRRAAAGEYDRRSEERGVDKPDEGYYRRTSGRHEEDDEEKDRHRRHRHHPSSSRHRHGDRDDRSRRHQHRPRDRKDSRSRSRSRSPETSSRHRRRVHDEDRHRVRGSSSRPERDHRDEDSNYPRSSDRRRSSRDAGAGHRSPRDH